MEFHRKVYRQLVGIEKYSAAIDCLKQSISKLTGIDDYKRIENALWNINPTISYNTEDGVGVLLPGRDAGFLMVELKYNEGDLALKG